MLNSPITGDEYLDTFLYDLRDEVINLTGTSTTTGSSTYQNPHKGSVTGYPYRYMHVKYADDNIGTGFSNSQTNKKFFGIYNSDLTTESTNPTDYSWIEVGNGGFNTINNMWYIVTTGRQLGYFVGSSSPGTLYSIEPGSAIDLNLVSAIADQSARMAYTLVFDLLLASPSFYQSTGSLSVPPINTWSGGETWSTVVPYLTPGSTMYQTDGIYNSTTGLTTWSVPYLAKLKVGSLTANNIIVGNSPAISGTGMTGEGALIKTDGTFALGDPTRNIVNTGSQLYINGFIKHFPGVSAIATTSNTFPTSQATVQDDLVTFTTNKGIFHVSITGTMSFHVNGSFNRLVELWLRCWIYDNTTGTEILNNFGNRIETFPPVGATTLTANMFNNNAHHVPTALVFSSQEFVTTAGTIQDVSQLSGHNLTIKCYVVATCTAVGTTTLISELSHPPFSGLKYIVMDTSI